MAEYDSDRRECSSRDLLHGSVLRGTAGATARVPRLALALGRGALVLGSSMHFRGAPLPRHTVQPSAFANTVSQM